MTKEEVIQQAYGEYWEQVKEFVDENGRLKVLWGSIFHNPQYENLASLLENMVDVSGIEFEGEYYARPKSLQGIENNNNWIKIESFNDFPKEEDVIEYWVLDDGEIINAKFMHESKNWYHGDNLNLRLFPTHYQPIEKPKPPIY